MQDISLLKEALPYLRRFKGAAFVVKFGGEAIRTPEQTAQLAQDLSFLYSVGIQVVLIHGGGAQVTEMETRLGVTSEKVGGRRITSRDSLEVLAMVLGGKMNAQMCAALRAQGVRVAGMSVLSGPIIEARRRPPIKVSGGGDAPVDFGEVGEVVSVDPTLLRHLLGQGYLPVLSPLAADDEGNLLNINADTVAARIAGALGAEKLLLMIDKLGVMHKLDDPTTLISQLDARQAREAITQGIISGGMIPKVEEALDALSNGVRQAHILSALEPHQLLLEIFTDTGCGTMLLP